MFGDLERRCVHGRQRSSELLDARGESPGAVDLESRTTRFALNGGLSPNAPDTPLVQSPGAALRSRRLPQAPIALVRNGKEFKISGDQSTVKAGTHALFNSGRQQSLKAFSAI
jgi:hypothetical protein